MNSNSAKSRRSRRPSHRKMKRRVKPPKTHSRLLCTKSARAFSIPAKTRFKKKANLSMTKLRCRRTSRRRLSSSSSSCCTMQTLSCAKCLRSLTSLPSQSKKNTKFWRRTPKAAARQGFKSSFKKKKRKWTKPRLTKCQRKTRKPWNSSSWPFTSKTLS